MSIFRLSMCVALMGVCSCASPTKTREVKPIAYILTPGESRTEEIVIRELGKHRIKVAIMPGSLASRIDVAPRDIDKAKQYLKQVIRDYELRIDIIP